MLVNVAISRGSGAVFTYAVPEDLHSPISPGKRVLVPLGTRRATGYIIEITEDPPQKKLKDIIDVIDEEPLFDDGDLSFYRWISRYYLYPLGKTLGDVLPPGIDVKNDRWITLFDEPREPSERLSKERRHILETLKSFPEGCRQQSLKRICRSVSFDRDLYHLAKKGYVKLEERVGRAKVQKKMETLVLPTGKSTAALRLTEKQRAVMDLVAREAPEGGCLLSFIARDIKNPSPTVKTLEQKGLLETKIIEKFREPPPPPIFNHAHGAVELNEDQARALKAVRRAVEDRKYAPFLLHGVTGSGKTEVYLGAIETALASGGSALLMVPEIALTSQLINRVRRRFDDSLVALYHSGLSEGERYDQWRKMKRGAARILIGARSAVFVPAVDLRLIVVDEEHDQSYKQEERLPYNARDLALVRARMQEAAVVLGSATPDVQTFFNVSRRGFTYLSLPTRVEDRPLPVVHIVDTKEPAVRRGKDTILSSPLVSALGETLEEGNQSLLLLNRRGFTTFLYCGDCGHVFNCRHCSVTMTHHLSRNRLKCHYCDYTIETPAICPECKVGRIISFGAGTEKLLQEVKALFPGARVGRLDSDAVTKRADYEAILSALDKREIDILVGTQMIAKGHDFPHVTLVGVVSADSSLNIPDFRASERTFQLLTQVAGRGGRGRSPARVFIQTINPFHTAVQKAASHDYRGFYEKEIPSRQETGFPPFQRMINIRITSAKEEKAMELGRLLAETARKHAPSEGIFVLGPAEPPIARIKGKYRRQLLLKGPDAGPLHDLAALLLRTAGRRASDIKVDVDPLNFM